MKVLVTGGSGFLGTEIIKKLLIKNFNVFNLDLIPFIEQNIKNYQIDILDYDNLENIFKENKFDIVIHSCAKVPISKSKKTFHQINVNGTKNVLELSKKYNVKRFVYISSSAVYGVPKIIPIKEDDPREPVESYGLSKKNGEDLCLNEIDNISIGIIRPRTVIGKDRLGIFSILFEWVRLNLPVPVINNGENFYQFIDIDDLVEAICLMAVSDYRGAINIGSKSYITIRELLEKLIKTNSSKSKIKNLDSNIIFKLLKFCIKYKIVPLQDYHYLAYGKNIYFDTTLSKEKLNWESKISNFDSIQSSYKNFINKESIDYKNKAVHKKPLKSYLLKYASLFL